jgi:hypothetical protein
MSIRASFVVALFSLFLAGNSLSSFACDAGTSNMQEQELSVEAQAEALNAQKVSIYHMFALSGLIEKHKTETGRTPQSLEDLAAYLTPKGFADFVLDGWKRRIYYSSNGSDFTLFCFGLDGIPNAKETVLPGGYTPHLDFDADIIIINNRWARSPDGLNRPF